MKVKYEDLDDSGSEFSEIASVSSEGCDDFAERTSDEGGQLTAKNLEALKYQQVLNNMKDLNYQYWRRNLDAVKAHNEERKDDCKKFITEAASLVTQNPDRLTNKDHKAVVIYNYLRFTNDSSYNGIASKKALIKYMPEVLWIAEQVQDKEVVNKVLKIMDVEINGDALVVDSSLNLKMSDLSISDVPTKKDDIEIQDSSNEPVKARGYSLDPGTSEEDNTAPRESEFSTSHNADHVDKIAVNMVGEVGVDH